MATKYSIECALPYVSELGDIQGKFDVALRGLETQLDQKNESYSRVLLVDDVTNDGGQDYDLNAYIVASNGARTSDVLVMRESMLNNLASGLLNELSQTLTNEELNGLKSEKGYSSPFYIAVWSLIRLGHLSHPSFPKGRVAEKITNILPEIFREGEEESVAIIRKTRFAEAANQIEYIFVRLD